MSYFWSRNQYKKNYKGILLISQMANSSHLRKNSFKIILIFFLVLSNIYYAKADVVWVDTFDDESYLDN